MAKRDGRKKKFNNLLDNDIEPIGLLRTLIEMNNGISSSEAKQRALFQKRMLKLDRLMEVYGIKEEAMPDIFNRTLALTLALATEFVRGFEYVELGKGRKNSSPPRSHSEQDWLELFKKIKDFESTGKSINAACTHAASNMPSFKSVAPLSLAAMYRREKKSLEKYLTGEMRVGRYYQPSQGYLQAIERLMSSN